MASREQLAVNLISKFLTRHEFVEGHRFISSLESSIIQTVEVGIISAEFYVRTGKLALAEKSLEIAGFHSLFVDNASLLDERIACMALLSAKIRMKRRFEYESTFKIAHQIKDIYCHLKCRSRLYCLEPCN